MDELESLCQRVIQEVIALSVELGDIPLPPRGERISPEMNDLGDVAARHWLQTGQRPIRPDLAYALFPRFWFANAFLKHALLHGTEPLKGIPPRELPKALLLDVWEEVGRAEWEAPKMDHPWGG